MFYRASLFLLCSSAATLFGASESAAAASQDGSPVVVSVDGKNITLAEFERQRPLALFQAKNTYSEAEKKAVEGYIDEYLLETQAKKENLTVPQLIDLHVNSKVAKDPSDDALLVYYEGLDTTEPFDAVKDKIRDHLRERRVTKLKTAYMASLRNNAKISIQIAPPRAPVTAGHAPMRGVADAPITMIEYADYECPYCQQVAPDLARLEADFKGKLAFVYKDFPLPMHPHAQKASEAAQCAGAQNKYWEFHDFLLSSKQLEIPQLKAEAKTLGLDAMAFNKCLDFGERADVVKANFEEGMQLGITGTPVFFVNGRFISGTMPYDQLRQILTDELKALPVAPQQQASKR